ncbi:hypothetical protein ACFY2M_40735 [Streptomyces sp. NPDC001276]|uniref:hypothetical protein n=1 Tax=Streptomyces sp. NPDC001276 TaxID=3364555 RepID=UPI0036BB6417
MLERRSQGYASSSPAVVDELREQMTTELGLLNDRMPKMGWLDIAERKSGAIRLTPA